MEWLQTITIAIVTGVFSSAATVAAIKTDINWLKTSTKKNEKDIDTLTRMFFDMIKGQV